DQSGQKGPIAEVDHFRAGGTADRGSHFADSIAFHQYFAGHDHAPRLDIERSRSVEHDGVSRSGLREVKRNEEKGQAKQSGEDHGQYGSAQATAGAFPVLVRLAQASFSCVRVRNVKAGAQRAGLPWADRRGFAWLERATYVVYVVALPRLCKPHGSNYPSG